MNSISTSTLPMASQDLPSTKAEGASPQTFSVVPSLEEQQALLKRVDSPAAPPLPVTADVKPIDFLPSIEGKGTTDSRSIESRFSETKYSEG